MPPVLTAQADKAFDNSALDRSVQVQPPTPFYSEAGSAIFMVAQFSDEIEPWGRNLKLRDQQLRDFYPNEPLLMSALGTVISRNSAFSWKLEGPDKEIQRHQDVLHGANFGKGWTNLIARLSLDLYTQDAGAFIEVIREADSEKAPIAGLANLDAHRCYHTGMPETPVIYQDLWGKYHLMKWYQVVTIVEMPSSVEARWGQQYCAVTRLLRAARLMRDIGIYLQEKVGGRNTRAVTLVRGVTPKQISEAWDQAQSRLDAAGFMRFSQPIMIGAVDPNAQLGFETLELASLPDGFDLDLSQKQYITQLALAFLTDYQDFAPLPGGGLGTSTQSEILHAKSRGKGAGLFQTLIADALNFLVLPPSVQFTWDEQDVGEDKSVADLKAVRATERKTRIDSGELTPEVARMIALEAGDLTQEQFDELEKQNKKAAQEAAAAPPQVVPTPQLAPTAGPGALPQEQKPAAQGQQSLPGEVSKEQDARAGGISVSDARLRVEDLIQAELEDSFTKLWIEMTGGTEKANAIHDRLGRFGSGGGAPAAPGAASASLAEGVHAKAVVAEKVITPDVTAVAGAVGAQMTGLEFAVKGRGSTADKIYRDSVTKHIKAPVAAARVGDSVRYTATFSPEGYAKGVGDMRGRLTAQGHTEVQFKNYWTKPPSDGSYHGINSNWRAPNGHIYELQYHTPASWHTKDVLSHPDYIIARNMSLPKPERNVAKARMRTLWSTFPHPPGVAALT
jgi:hypothetical protein